MHVRLRGLCAFCMPWMLAACGGRTEIGDAADIMNDHAMDSPVVGDVADASGAGDAPATDIADAGDAADGGNARWRMDGASIAHFAQALVIPPAMPLESRVNGVAMYRIAVHQIRQQILPPPMPATTVWAYGRDGDPATFHSPGFTVETRTNERVRVTWINGLIDGTGHHIPHFLPIDNTLHWADPQPTNGATPPGEQYTGPVPIVTHVHGSHVADQSDGNPDAWFLPAATDVPPNFTTRGPSYHTQQESGAGTAVFDYTNDQRAETLWYHDHALGITRLNVYAGLAGFWLVRDATEDALGLPGPAPRVGDAPDTAYYEIPIAIQDRSFWTDGALAYPTSRQDFDGYDGPYAPSSDVPPIWNPEVFGDVMVVNGVAWPYLNVEPRLYRIRFLNGTDARFLRLRFNRAGLRFVQIGNEGGLLADGPVTLDELIMAPAERADVVVDFSSLAPGDAVVLQNTGPDEPFQGPMAGQPPADPRTTGQVMQFRVVARTTSGSAGTVPTSLPGITPLASMGTTRDLLIAEQADVNMDIPVMSLLGTVHDGPLHWTDPATETPHVGDIETWRLVNTTPDAHPIHLHLVHFQVVDRTPYDDEAFLSAENQWVRRLGPEPRPDDFVTGAPVAPEAWESGWKDTVAALPGTITRIRAQFDVAGSYVWHCHILEHEDNEMMRPLIVLP